MLFQLPDWNPTRDEGLENEFMEVVGLKQRAAEKEKAQMPPSDLVMDPHASFFPSLAGTPVMYSLIPNKKPTPNPYTHKPKIPKRLNPKSINLHT